MRRYLVLVLLCWSALARAGDVSLVFDRVGVLDLARILYGEILHVPYVVSPDVLATDAQVTLKLSSVSPAQVAEQVQRVLGASGVDVIEARGGVRWLVKKPVVEEQQVEFVYTPRYRAVSYLLDALAGLFKPGTFPTQRAVSSPAVRGLQRQLEASGQAHAVAGEQQQQVARRSVVDTGTSAFSLASKNPDVLVFRGSAADLDKLQRLLPQVDVMTPELLVKAVVVEVSVGDASESALGVLLSALGGRVGLSLGAAVTDNAATLKLGGFQAVLHAMKSDSRFRVVSSPQLRVRSGGQARLMVGADVPVLGAVSVGNGISQQSVEYRSAGVILDLAPTVFADRTDLTITQQISDFQKTTTGVSTSPTLTKRELSTMVSVSSGDVLVLGGLDQERNNESSSGLPFLPSIFGSSSDRSKSQILLVLEATRI